MTGRTHAPLQSSGCADVWIVDLAALGSRLVVLEQERHLLSDAERARASAISDPARSARWIAAHVALHLTLADRLGAPVRFADNAGKPRVANWDGDFSLTHSGDLALIAICEAGQIGIDAEVRRPVTMGASRRRLVELAGAAILVDRMLPDDADMRFLAAWVRLEAIGKMRATGIGALLETLGIVAQGPGADAVAERARRLVADDAQPIGICDLDVSRFDAVAALASSPPSGQPRTIDLASELVRLVG